MEDFMMDEKTLKTTPAVAGLQNIAVTTMFEKISQLLLQNRHLSLRMLADELKLVRTQ
jgi:hypothetical protein